MPRRALAIVLATILLVSAVSPLVSASVSTSVQTSYDGAQSDADQAVEVTYTISPEGDTANNLTVDLGSTPDSFIESQSISYTVSPGGAEVNVQSRPGDRYFVRELDPDEEITFVFNVYPKELKSEELDVAVVEAEYIQNGQELTNSDTVTADLSESPWFALQESERRGDSLQQQLTGMRAVMFGGAGVGVLGVLAAVGALVWKRRAISGLKQDLSGELDQLSTRMLNNGLEENSTEHKEFKTWWRDLDDDFGIPFVDTGPVVEPGTENPFDNTSGFDNEDDTDGVGSDTGGLGGDDETDGFGSDTGGFDDEDDTDGFGGGTGGFGGSNNDD